MWQLITISKSSHPGHNSQNVEISSVDTDFSSVIATDGVGGKDKLKGSVINSGEIASSRWLVLFWAEGERVDVNSGIRGASVVLEWLDEVEVGSFALGEAILTVKLELSR